MPCADYRTFVFDCDGVILDSNRVKTEAFRTAALPYGAAAAQALVSYHTSRGGISRYEKFRHFLEEIVPETAPGVSGPGLHDLLAAYALAVRDGLMACDITPGLEQLRKATPDSRWLIVSGGDQDELRDIFAQRGLAPLFDAGIFGSPDSKDVILAREIAAGVIQAPALFLGDSKYDLTASRTAGLDFVFISGWTEVVDWEAYIAQEGVSHIVRVQDLHIGA